MERVVAMRCHTRVRSWRMVGARACPRPFRLGAGRARDRLVQRFIQVSVPPPKLLASSRPRRPGAYGAKAGVASCARSVTHLRDAFPHVLVVSLAPAADAAKYASDLGVETLMARADSLAKLAFAYGVHLTRRRLTRPRSQLANLLETYASDGIRPLLSEERGRHAQLIDRINCGLCALAAGPARTA